MDAKMRLVIYFLCSGLCLAASAQSPDEIIEKHIAAHGGQEAWDKVEVIKVNGTFTAFSLEKDYTCYKTREGAYYGDFHLGEEHITESYDGSLGWTIDPWQEISYAREINAGEENVFMQKAEFFTPFYRYKERGFTVEYTGKDTIDGMEMYALKLTRTNGKTEEWFLDTKSYLEYHCRSEWVDFARTVPSEVYFDDFREVDGLLLPFYIERTFWQRSRILQIDNIEIIPSIDESLFVMPARPEMKKLEFLEGEWNVKIEAYTRRGTWHDFGSTMSSFSFADVNLLKEEITYDRIFRFSKIFCYTYDDNRKSYKITEYNALTTSMELFDGYLSDTSFVFDNTRILTDDEEDDQEYVQYTITDITDDGFVIYRKQSTDQGETWSHRDRFTYSRE